MTLTLAGKGGSITVPKAVISGIAARAAERVEGVSVRRRRTVDLEAGLVALSVAVRRDEQLVRRGEEAQQEVAAALETMCGIEARVDITIVELA